MWLLVNMVDESGKVSPVWSLSSSQMQSGQWVTGRVKLDAREAGAQYKVCLGHTFKRF